MHRVNGTFERTLGLAIKLPTSVLHRVAEFVPVAPLYDRRLQYLAHRMITDPHDVVMDAMPMFDELLCEASASVQDTGGPKSSATNRTSNLLFRLREDSAYEYRFRRWGPLPLPTELLQRLKKLGYVQASLGEYGAEGLRCSRPIAQEAVELLEAVLVWFKQRQQHRPEEIQ